MTKKYEIEDDVGLLDDFDNIFARTAKLEGGYTEDHAGPTNIGITQDTYNLYRTKKNLPIQSVKTITFQEAKDIAKEEYYQAPKFDMLPNRVAGLMFDYGFNAGPFTATKKLQEAVGTKADGVLGPKTKEAVNKYINTHGEDDLLKKILDKRKEQYQILIRQDPQKFKKYENGWMNRINELKKDLNLSMLNPFAVKEASAGSIYEIEDDIGLDKPPAIPGKDLYDIEDDLGILGTFEPKKQSVAEHFSKDFIAGTKTLVQETAKGVLRGTQGIVSGTGGLMDILGQNVKIDDKKAENLKKKGMVDDKYIKRMNKIGDKLSLWGKTAKDFWTKASEQGIARPNPEVFKGTFMQNPSWIRGVSTVAGAIPSLGAATVASMATGNPLTGLAFLGALEAEPIFAGAREAGVPLGKANLMFGASAIGTSILEALPITRFMRGGSGKLTKDIFIGAGQEGTEEILQGLWNNAIEKIGFNKTKDLTEGLVESFIGGAGSGGVLGGVTSGRGIKIDAQIQEAIQAGVTPTEISILQEAVKNQIVDKAPEIEKVIEQTKEAVPDTPTIPEVVKPPKPGKSMISEDRGYRGTVITRIEEGKQVWHYTDEEGRVVGEPYTTKEEAEKGRIKLAKTELPTVEEMQVRWEKAGVKKDIDIIRIETESKWRNRSRLSLTDYEKKINFQKNAAEGLLNKAVEERGYKKEDILAEANKIKIRDNLDYIDSAAIAEAVSRLENRTTKPLTAEEAVTQPEIVKPGASQGGEIQDFGEKIGGARKDTAERGYAKASIKKETATGPAWKNKYIAAEKVDKSGWSIIQKDQPSWASSERGQVFATQEEAEKAIPLYAVSKSHRVYQNKNKKWEIFKRVGERKLFKVVNQEFSEREEAMKYMAEHAEEILNLKTSFGEEILPIPEIATRKGVERRKGNADAKMFMETFSPRGIEFGNWNNQEERQQVLNHAYDGLLDLAEALGVSPRDLMLKGELGIAFGARGQGLVGAKAHYENDYGVINLTKMKGAGSLAHEWFHALDNYLARLDGKAKSERIKNSRGDLVFPVKNTADVMLSFGASYQSKLDKDLLAAYKNLVDGMFRKAEQYVEDTEKADKFLSVARDNLKNDLDRIRKSLESDLSATYTWRKNKVGLKPASAEQLAEFDKQANTLIEGGNLDTKFIKVEGSKNVWGGRTSNDSLEAINKILKTVRNRSGFTSTQEGSLDRVVSAMKLYKQRLDMFKDAQNKTEKTVKVPTSYAVEARKMDQARVGEYWSQPNEMAARAFAAYIEDKITQAGGQSDFIVYHAHGGIILPMIDGFVARPYPEGKEREAINGEFDKFFNKIKTILRRNEAGRWQVPIPEGLATPEGRESLYQKTINRFQSIENTVVKAKKLGADILPGEDAGLSATRYLSIANQADSTLKNGTFIVTPEGKVKVTGEGLKLILDQYDESSIEKNAIVREQELKDYLISRRTIEDLQRPKSEQDTENIVTPEQVAKAEQQIAALKNKHGDLQLFEDTAIKIYDYQKRVLHLLVDSGNISQEMYDTIVARNPHYVSFDRIIPEETTGGTPVNKNRFSGARSPIKRIKGSELEIHDPIESMIKNTYRIMDVSARNKVFNDIYKLKDIEQLGIASAKIQMRPINVTEEETGAEELTIFRPSQFKPKGNVVEGYVKGKRKYLEVPKNLYDAMTGLTETSSNLMVKILSMPAHWLRTGATITPEFMLRNPLRDQWTALLQTNLGWKPVVDTMGAIADIVKKKDVYQEWIRSGGSYAGFVELSRPNLKRLVSDLRGKPDLLKSLNIVARLQDVSQLFEQATRVGVYKAGIRKGLSAVEAAKQSREATLDFARRGSLTRDINSTVAFFNAGVQAFDKSVRVIGSDPKGFTLKALATITLPSLLLYLINREDDEYKELPRWQKDLFWVLKVNGIWFRIPKPFAYGQVFGSLPERLFEFIDSKDKSAFNDLASSLYNSLSPISDDPLSGLLPTAIKPLIENQVNWSFFLDRPIVSFGKERLIPSEQYTKYDTETAKMLGRLTNVSPSKIENLVRGYFGGSGRYVLEAGDLAIKGIDKLTGVKREAKKPAELSDIPLVKGFVVREGSAESVNTFYENRNRLEKIYNTYRSYKKSGQEQRAEKFKKANPEIMQYPIFRSTADKFSDFNKELDKIVANEKLPDAVKREKIRLLNKKKIEMARRANAILK